MEKKLTQAELSLIEYYKEEKGCSHVFVDSTYSSIKLFPIYNNAQLEFVKEIFEKGNYSRFDSLIMSVLELKHETLEECIESYLVELDFLD